MWNKLRMFIAIIKINLKYFNIYYDKIFILYNLSKGLIYLLFTFIVY